VFRTYIAILKAVWGPVFVAARVVIGKIAGLVTGLRDKIKTAASKMGGFLKGIWDGVKSAGKTALNGVIDLINGAIKGINKLIKGANKVPGVDIPTISEIPKLALGASRFKGGPVEWGERGPETAIFPNGTKVLSHQQTKRQQAEQSGGVTINVNEYGPRSSVGRVREADWLYRFGPRVGVAR
jgi:phage-related protein